jgi:regulator of sirC expression with transglutaminase-like and TPR domain
VHEDLFRRFLTYAVGLFICQHVAAQGNSATRHPHVLVVKSLLETPEADIDFAKAKVAIDRLIEPAIDTEATLRHLDNMAADIRSRLPLHASTQQRAQALREYLYDPGPWNAWRPFSYDFTDAQGRNLSIKLLANYLRTRKGNCVSMPFLYIALAQKLGLTVVAATTPEHMLVKLRDDVGVWHNIDTTSGGWPRRDESYHRDARMTPEAIANRIYLRPLSKRQTVAVMASVLAEHHSPFANARPDIVMALTDLQLAQSPTDVEAMIRKGSVYYLLLKARFPENYQSPQKIPAHERHQWLALSKENQYWFEKAEALGWRQPTQEDEERYVNMIKSKAAAQR